MKPFKITITVILAVAGVVCFGIGHTVLGCIVFGAAIAVWTPKNGGNSSSSSSSAGLSLKKKWWWMNNN